MDTSELLTLGGVAIVVTILTEVIKRAAAMSDDVIARFGPLLAVTLGVVIAILASWYQGADLVAGALTGLLAGASASGIYSYTKGVSSAGKG
jgi:hypothetical protein